MCVSGIDCNVVTAMFIAFSLMSPSTFSIYLATSVTYPEAIFWLTVRIIRGKRGNQKGEFNQPYAVCVEWQSIANNWLLGSDDGELNGPNHLCFDDKKRHLIVADWDNHRIQVFTADGRFVHKFGSQGSGDTEFHCPRGVCSICHTKAFQEFKQSKE